jgi:uncharacterized protein YdhG (YjbR/CyaY superfamily)
LKDDRKKIEIRFQREKKIHRSLVKTMMFGIVKEECEIE